MHEGETCTMAPVVEPVGGALHAFVGSMRWNTGRKKEKKSLADFFKVECEEFHMQWGFIFFFSNLNYILCLRSLFSARHGKYWLSLPSMKMWHAMFPAMHQITQQKKKTMVIKCSYLLYSNHIGNSYVIPPPFLIFLFWKWNRVDDTGLGDPCPLSLYIEVSYRSLRCLIATTEC